jgi:hypothetical protein
MRLPSPAFLCVFVADVMKCIPSSEPLIEPPPARSQEKANGVPLGLGVGLCVGVGVGAFVGVGVGAGV